MPTPIRDVMTPRVVTVRSGEPVAVAVERMTRFGFSALPVVTASGRLVGIVSLLDVLRLRHGAPADEGAVAVDEIMTRDVLTMAATANVAAVADRLRRGGALRVLPVVDGGRLVGVVTRGDLLRRLLLPDVPRRRRRLFGLLGGADPVDPLPAPRGRRPPAVPDAPVRDVMTTAVVTAAPTEPLTEVAIKMLRGRHSGLPVVDGDGRLCGVVSEADLLDDPSVRPAAGRVMTAPALSVPADATVAQARALVVEHGLRTLPVVDGDGRLVGVLSRSDLV